MMTTQCPESRRLLKLFASDDPAVVRHVKGCVACTEEVAAAATLADLLGDLGEVRSGSTSGFARRWLPLAGVAALAVLALATVLFGGLEPVRDVSGVRFRGVPGGDTWRVTASSDGGEWTFVGAYVSGADEYVLEIWSVEADEPLRMRSPRPRFEVSTRRLNNWGGRAPRYWSLRAERAGRVLAAAPVERLGGGP